LAVIAFVRKHKKLSALLVFIGAIAGSLIWDASARIRGQAAARFDLALGHYRILTLGLPTPWRPEWMRLLRQRYGVEERMVAGCIVSESLLAYTDGYNRLSMGAANRKFGHDIFKETMADAIKNRRARPAAAVH
jgi:hypothetical protein